MNFDYITAKLYFRSLIWTKIVSLWRGLTLDSDLMRPLHGKFSFGYVSRIKPKIIIIKMMQINNKKIDFFPSCQHTFEINLTTVKSSRPKCHSSDVTKCCAIFLTSSKTYRCRDRLLIFKYKWPLKCRFRFHTTIRMTFLGVPAVGGLKFSMAHKKLQKCKFGEVPVGEVPVWERVS